MKRSVALLILIQFLLCCCGSFPLKQNENKGKLLIFGHGKQREKMTTQCFQKKQVLLCSISLKKYNDHFYGKEKDDYEFEEKEDEYPYSPSRKTITRLLQGNNGEIPISIL